MREFSNLNQALNDQEFCDELNSRNIDKCLEMLGSRDLKQQLLLMIEDDEEGIDPYEHITKLNGDLIPSIGIKKYYIPEGIKIIEPNTFAFRVEIEDIIIPNTVNVIGERAFNSCGIEQLLIPDSVKSIGMYCFKYCQTLSEIKLSDNITIIEPGTFLYCTNLNKVYLPKNLKTIATHAFDHCPSLSELHYPGTMDDWNKLIVVENNWCQETLKSIICSDGILKFED